MNKMKQNIWSKTFCKRVRGGKYDPHQGEQEKARRRNREVAKKLCPNAKVTLIDGRTDKNEWAIRMPMSAYNQFTESIPKCQKTMANTQR